MPVKQCDLSQQLSAAGFQLTLLCISSACILSHLVQLHVHSRSKPHVWFLCVQGTCASLILADLTPLAPTSAVPSDMLSYTVYLGAFQNSTTHAGPNALAFQGCPGDIFCLLNDLIKS